MVLQGLVATMGNAGKTGGVVGPNSAQWGSPGGAICARSLGWCTPCPIVATAGHRVLPGPDNEIGARMSHTLADFKRLAYKNSNLGYHRFKRVARARFPFKDLRTASHLFARVMRCSMRKYLCYPKSFPREKYFTFRFSNKAELQQSAKNEDHSL